MSKQLLKSNQPEAVIAAFGGTFAVARLLNAPATTVSSWKANGRIPSWRWAVLVAHAPQHGVKLREYNA